MENFESVHLKLANKRSMADLKHNLAELKVMIFDDSGNMLNKISTILLALGVRNVFETLDGHTALSEWPISNRTSSLPIGIWSR